MAYTNIDDPSAYFQTKVYTGSNANQSITNDGNSDLQPDFIFASYRTLPPYTNHRAIIDSSRGRAKILESDTTAAEATTTLPAYDLVSFDTNGFTVGPVNSTSALNASGISHVAWQWKANGGTTSSNTDGDLTSTVQANQDAGFSIVTWTGNTTGSSQTIGHGLGAAPKTIIVKDRDSTASWVSYHEPLGTGKYLQLHSNAAQGSISNYWSSTAPSSTVFGVIGDNGGAGYANNVSGNDMIAYCFAEKQGYSKFGKYVGNGNSNGPFVYTGFKPAFLIMKRTDSTGNWVMFDTKRDTHNVTKHRLFPNLTNADNTTRNYIDLLSNGFKMRDTDVDHNASGATIIYMAFAENPFVTSTGVPTTAR